MSKGTESGGRKSKRTAKSGGKAKPKEKGKRKREYPSYQGTTEEARKRAASLIPSRNFAIIASDPLKAQIVAVALQRPYSPSEYARESGVSLQVASYAFKVLREKGILELVEEPRVRGTIKHMYRATEAAIVSNADWGDLGEALRPVFTGTILQDFSARVTQAIETGHLFSRDDFCLYWVPRDLDEIAWREQVEIYSWCIEESERLEADTVNRRANGEGDGGSFHTTFAIAAFPSPTHSEFKKHKTKKGRGKRKAPKEKAKAKAKTKGTAKAERGGKGGKA
jgi:DNA-binding transcriptional ArsR family regulator